MDTLLVDIRFGVSAAVPAARLIDRRDPDARARHGRVDRDLLRRRCDDVASSSVPDPEQLVASRSRSTRPATGAGRRRRWPTCAMAGGGRHLRAVAGSGGAFRGRITDGASPERIRVDHFTEDYLPMHGVMPILGRGFTRDDTDRLAAGRAARIRLLAKPVSAGATTSSARPFGSMTRPRRSSAYCPRGSTRRRRSRRRCDVAPNMFSAAVPAR